MKYRIEISSVAESEADGAFLRVSQVTSPARATQWYSGLLQAIFTVLEGQSTSVVRILHLRHASQQTIGEEPDEPDVT